MELATFKEYEEFKHCCPTCNFLYFDTVTHLFFTKNRVYVTLTFKFPVQRKNKELTNPEQTQWKRP
jgi:hypothetical protein